MRILTIFQNILVRYIKLASCENIFLSPMKLTTGEKKLFAMVQKGKRGVSGKNNLEGCQVTGVQEKFFCIDI